MVVVVTSPAEGNTEFGDISGRTLASYDVVDISCPRETGKAVKAPLAPYPVSLGGLLLRFGSRVSLVGSFRNLIGTPTG